MNQSLLLPRWRRGIASTLLVSTLVLAGGARSDAAAQLIRRGPATACRDVALTFDTEFGASTPALVDTLEKLNVKTTWFLLAGEVERNAPLVRRIAARHQIGNHTFGHPAMSTLSETGMRWEIATADKIIEQVAGVSPRPLFRPPYGDWNQTLLNAAESEGYTSAFLWSVDTRDWAGPSAAEIRQHVVQNIHPGAIVLQHGSARHSVEGTRLYVGDLRARGYQFVTLTELMGIDRDQRDFGGDAYVIQYRDTWAQVGACHNVSGPRLAAYNGNPDTPVGYVINIPHKDELVIEIDGQRPELPVYPRVLPPGWSVAPVRLAEHLGATVEWDGERVHVYKDGLEMVITPGSSEALVNGVAKEMGVAATWAEERVLLPVRFLAEELGYTVTWNGATWVASLTSGAE
ncbi:MAG: polysaccharide deacetylase [Symbiobacteriaceae bacterium]|jgi:peptidoglycan/xylan/chitin deacetylase (PgdA/CDA1 family)|nr:polysaccharide deacetylase [Symbiobacteriaceae bacterium]